MHQCSFMDGEGGQCFPLISHLLSGIPIPCVIIVVVILSLSEAMNTPITSAHSWRTSDKNERTFTWYNVHDMETSYSRNNAVCRWKWTRWEWTQHKPNACSWMVFSPSWLFCLWTKKIVKSCLLHKKIHVIAYRSDPTDTRKTSPTCVLLCWLVSPWLVRMSVSAGVPSCSSWLIRARKQESLDKVDEGKEGGNNPQEQVWHRWTTCRSNGSILLLLLKKKKDDNKKKQ